MNTQLSGGVSTDFNGIARTLAFTILHSIGHNSGLDHDFPHKGKIEDQEFNQGKGHQHLPTGFDGRYAYSNDGFVKRGSLLDFKTETMEELIATTKECYPLVIQQINRVFFTQPPPSCPFQVTDEPANGRKPVQVVEEDKNP